MRALFIFSLFFLFFSKTFSQSGGQVVRGTTSDHETRSRLPFTNIALFKDSLLVTGTTSDSVGKFRMENIAPGRYILQATYIGYNPLMLRNIEVTSGKESVLNLEMEESVQSIGEVTVTATQKGEVLNEMATVSTRIFAAEETQRYAGSRADIARMASNFAGVQGSDDSRNDIVVRGNSPLGILWRVDEVDIPNPNHFAAPGTSGGPVSALNSRMFGSSDFMTGAFPAEYGNATAGVFDLKMRPGNNEKHEFTGQVGFLGLELSGEGPLSKSNAAPSYLFSYRYSTLDVFEKLKIPIGTSAVPHYQDAGFKINFPGKSGKDNFSIFAIGGKSDIEIIKSKLAKPEENIYDESNRDEYFGSSFAVAGVNYSRTFGKNLFLKVALSSSAEEGHSYHQLVYRDSFFKVDSLVDKLRYKFVTAKNSAAVSLTKKFSSRSTVKAGIFADMYHFNFKDSIYIDNSFVWNKRMDSRESALLIQPYIQWKYKLSNVLVLNSGLHAQYFTLNGSRSVEPRAGLQWSFADKQSLSFGYGLHSRMLPVYLYFIRYPQAGGEPELLNKNLNFLRAHHAVVTYDLSLSPTSRIKTEAYFQWLYNVPVNYFSSSYSMLNEGSSFDRIFPTALVNKGTGTNYGLELTYEKFFSENYFLLATGSLFNSQYKGSDGIERNTDFNGVYAVNLLAGKEFVMGKKKNTFFITNGKVTYAGGGRYTPPDLAASQSAGTLIEIDSLRNSKQFRNYFRADIKLGIKINTSKKITHEIAIDLVNIFNTKNILELTYSPDVYNPSKNPLHEIYQLGRLPLFYYKIDF